MMQLAPVAHMKEGSAAGTALRLRPVDLLREIGLPTGARVAAFRPVLMNGASASRQEARL